MKLFIVGLDSVLLLLFLAQSLVVGCLIAYGYIPLPTKWTNKKLSEKQFGDFQVQASSFRLKLGQEIELIGLKIYHDKTRDPILKAASAEIRWGLQTQSANLFNLNELVLNNGTLIMPAVYAPDGKQTTVLENITFHLSKTTQKIQINSIVAKHEDIYLRGSIEWPLKARQKKGKTSINQFYELVTAVLKEKENFSSFIKPTLEFNLSVQTSESTKVALLLSCERLKHPQITGSYFRLGTNFVLSEGDLLTESPLLLRAREITFADLDVFAEAITAHVKAERWPEIFQGILPKFEISTYRLTVHDVELNAPQIEVEPSAFPILQFSGTTCGLKGSARYSGAFNSQNRSGKVEANGDIDIFNLLPDSLVAKLPELEFNSTPFYDLSVLFDKEFKVRNASFYVNVKELTANKIRFDNIIAKGNYRDDILRVENIHIDRQRQWVDADFQLNSKTQDFQISLLGSIFPKQYNSLLPKWWSMIFKDLHFEPGTPGYGDFAIYGKTKVNPEISLFGYAQVDNFRYREAFFDTCELNVIGRQNYVEIDNIKATVGSGRATGKLGFTNARKPQKGLISVRYHFDASLPIEVASKSIGGPVAAVIENFELTELPDVQVDGVFFNKKFEDYAGKNSIALQAKVDAPLEVKDTPLDYLNFDLSGQGNNIYLRDVRFGYADGDGKAIIDVLPAEDSITQMCFKLALKNANQAKSVENLPGSKNDKQTVKSEIEKREYAVRSSGLVDLNLHAKGPLTNIYGYEGFGNMEVRNEALGSIQLLGPLSELLKNTLFDFTSFQLDHMNTIFAIDQEQLIIDTLEINGPRTRIWADGTLQLPDLALDMDVKVSLFANVGRPDSRINAFGRAIASPLPNLLSFKLTGTLKDQKVRSKFDPRNLIF